MPSLIPVYTVDLVILNFKKVNYKINSLLFITVVCKGILDVITNQAPQKKNSISQHFKI